MFVETLFSPIFGSLLSSPYFIVFAIIVLPLIGFALYIHFFLRRRGVGRVAANAQGAASQAAVEAQGQAGQPAQSGDRLEELAKLVGQLNSRIERVESNLMKAVSGGFGEVMGELRSLSEKLEDAVLAIKAAQSDAQSPFNEPQENPQPAPVDVKGSNDGGVKPGFGGGAALRQEFGDHDVGRLLEACAILEILGYNRRQVELLFEVGLLDVEHLELIGRVERVLEKYGSGLRARDVAEILLRTSPPQSALREDVRRVLRVLHELGEVDAGRGGE